MATWMTRQQRTVLSVAILASFIAFLDGSVVHVALPAISEELGGGLASQQWIVDAYLLTLGSIILLAGSLSDVFGRKRVLLAGLIGFGFASLACALAPSAELLIAARALQGVAGALLVPSSLALILDAFADGTKARAIGTWTAFTSVASIAGPVLGGLLVDWLSWRWVFGINVLPIAVTLILMRGLAPDAPRAAGTRVDVIGALLGIAGLGLPVFALIEQPRFGWGSPIIVGALALGLVSFVAFVLWERRAPQPMLPLGIFRARNFSVGNVATFFVYGGLSIGTFALAVFLQQGAGYSATLAGFAMVPSSIVLIALSAFFGRLSGRLGPRLMMTVGPLVAGTGFALMLRITEEADYLTQVLPAVLLFGLGLAITVAPLTATILGAVESTHSGIASATNNAVSRVAGLIAVALAGSLGGSAVIDLASFHQLVAAAAMGMLIGAVVSAVGIQNPSPVQGLSVPHAEAAPLQAPAMRRR
ncbi:DHA2 family efflux MFS transporter permease subunit [Agromyces endophyticus]|uniref:DHA2 family efflux MFS transporter permease subunit n=1 Tax=Agromyces sp. H17E-10 TaxID=2932244 RepID=UPI001FD217D3|nr:DHA2 family efflux MFS transporter permease subunit [Agromyces sp. H17E-10]UOQ88062.1 DHA2 family efflux MFS transporter permease subunit [Agromyces sp. H17E-10]